MMVESHSLSRRLRLLAALSQAKALAEPSPMARLGLAQTGSAWPGIRLWAGPGTSLEVACWPIRPPSGRLVSLSLFLSYIYCINLQLHLCALIFFTTYIELVSSTTRAVTNFSFSHRFHFPYFVLHQENGKNT